MSFTTVGHCGNDHAAWLKSIEFYEGEFDILKARLLEIAGKNSGTEVSQQVEHFQNQFIVQRNNIDVLKQHIHEHDGKVSKEALAHSGKMDTAFVHQHQDLKEEFDSKEKVINGLRHEFNQFLSKWM